MHQKAALVLAVVVLAATAVPAGAGDYRLAPDDIIGMNVWGEPQLSQKQFQVTSEGNITVPFLNNVIHAAGLTQQELAQKIAELFVQGDLLKDPKVEITLIKRHEMVVWVLGQAQRPGVVPFKEGDTITSAIAQAGSYTSEARLEAAVLTRRQSDKPTPLDLRRLYHDGDLSQDYPLQEGDVIYIPEDTYNRYYVLGEVYKPGLYPLKDNASVLSAISMAGGATPRGSLKGTVLVRGDITSPEKRVIDINKLIKTGDVAQDVKLEPGDVVYVPETSKPDWAKISQILNAVMSVGLIRRYGIF